MFIYLPLIWLYLGDKVLLISGRNASLPSFWAPANKYTAHTTQNTLERVFSNPKELSSLLGIYGFKLSKVVESI